MPRYTNTPPHDPRGHGLPILRTPVHKPIRAIITSPDLIGCNTHFWGGHTVPCEAPECEPCRNGIPYRWHSYCSAYNPDSGIHFIYECTALAAEVLVAFRKRFSTLRGCSFYAYRWRKAPNGRVILKCDDVLHPEIALPTAPDLQRLMAIIWQLPLDNVSSNGRCGLGQNVQTDPSAPNRQPQTPNPE